MLSGSIGNKIILLVSSVVTIALIVMMLLNVKQQEESTLAQNERDMAKITESVSQALQTLMLAGYADIAQNFARRLNEIEEIETFNIIRTDGTEAFLDNNTINRVNEVVGEEEFIPRETSTIHTILPADNPYLLKAIQSEQQLHFYSTNEHNEPLLTFLLPIKNLEDCQKCHGDDHQIRGVIFLTSSLVPVYDDIRKSKFSSLMLLMVTILVIIVATSIMVRHTIIYPVKRVTDAMSSASDGDLSQHVPVLGRDEISLMASSFNTMIERLLKSRRGIESEKKKLSTIILSTREGVVATNSDGEVVLVNPAAEILLGKSAEKIIADGIEHLIDNPKLIRKNMRSEKSTEILWLDKVLSLYAAIIYGEDGSQVGSAVLIREITTEKNLEKELRSLAITDELTGLYNRRYMNTLLKDEISSSGRYHVPLSILFFDIDFFKKFNDQHGHDQGDRVLTAVAQKCHEVLRDTDKSCRYGGEEFLIILSNTSQDLAFKAAERLRLGIEEMRVDGLQVTISIGVAEFPFLAPINIDSFVSNADTALYKAKALGRNRTELAEPINFNQ